MKNKHNLREYVRILFANGRLLLLLILIGAAIGLARAAWQQRTYLGNFELATGGFDPSGATVLPNPVEMRRLVMNPDVLKILTASGSIRPGENLEDKIRISPLVTSADRQSGVWRVTAEVPASSHQQAIEKLNEYVTNLQMSFEQRFAAEFVDMPVAECEKDIITLVALQVPPEETDENVKLPTLDELQAEARRLDVSLDSLESTIKKLNDDRDDQAEKIQSLQRELSVHRSTSRLITDEARSLPQEIVQQHPEIGALNEQWDQLNRRRNELAIQLRPAHPQLRAVDRQLQEVGERLKQAREQLRKSLEAKQKLVEDELNRMSALQMQQKQRLQELSALLEAKKRLDQPRPLPVPPKEEVPGKQAKPPRVPAKKDTKQATAPDRQPSEPPTLSEEPSQEPRRLPLHMAKPEPGKILVAGPFVSRSPVRPNTLRDTLLGATAGLVLGLMLVVVRAGADQRVHVPYHLDQLNLDVEVFGTIPEMGDESPVRISAKAAKT